VGTKIKVVPHINDSDEVRLELTEEISEREAASGTLGAVSITKRNAQTTVVVHDQQTVVIGGLMRDAVTTSDKKIPILGDIPVLGFLFRSTERGKRKTNLLLILTPYVVRDQNDLRSVFERKMQERQEFLDRYFVFSDQKHYEPPLDYSRTSGLVEAIRQAYLELADRKRLEDETRPRDVRVHDANIMLDASLQSIEVEKLLHEGDLFDYHAQREFAEIPKRAFAEMATTVVGAGAASLLIGVGQSLVVFGSVAGKAA